MSNSGGVNTTKTGLVVGIIVAVFFAVVFIGFGLLETAKYQRQADDSRSNYSEYTSDKKSETCIGPSRLEKMQCLYEADDKQREYDATQQDLVAQKTSALWAYIMGAAAVIGMGLSVIGVFLVWTTFRETKRSADLANSSLEYTKIITQRQIEAFVYIGSATYYDKLIEDAFDHREFGVVAFTLQNFGKTIAYDVSVTIDVLAPDFEGGGGKPVLAEEKFGSEFYPAGRSREYRVEFPWRDDLKSQIIRHFDHLEIEFSITYNLDSEESELHACHEGRMLAALSKDSDRADFVPPYKGWHTND